MGVTVTPETFSFIFFDAAVVADVATALLERLGLVDHGLHVVIDETTPLARMTVEMGSPIVVTAESGAFEDTKRPRYMSESAVALSLGRMLLRSRDRLDGTFGEAPADDDLSLAQVAAWDTYCLGRLAAMGYEINQQRWRYNFRNRHGFTDIADTTFDEIWSSPRLSWIDLDGMSNAAIDAKVAV